jgi:cysteine desulfurase/selenocysteine lyase
MVNEKWVKKILEDFPSLKNQRNGKPPIYFDNACTTLVPKQVIQAINEYYRGFPVCGGARSRHWFSQEVNDRIEGNSEKGIKGSCLIPGGVITEISKNSRFVGSEQRKKIACHG